MEIVDELQDDPDEWMIMNELGVHNHRDEKKEKAESASKGGMATH